MYITEKLKEWNKLKVEKKLISQEFRTQTGNGIEYNITASNFNTPLLTIIEYPYDENIKRHYKENMKTDQMRSLSKWLSDVADIIDNDIDLDNGEPKKLKKVIK
jgi:hypothetical protein